MKQRVSTEPHYPLAIVACLAASLTPATAVVGGLDAADPLIARHVVLVVGSRSTYCSGVALGRDLVLTAAHCVLPGGDYMIIESAATRDWPFKSLAAIALHPEFEVKAMLRRQPTADIALLKTAAPLPAAIVLAPLAAARSIMVGDRLAVAGYGVAVRRDGKTGGAVRRATVVGTEGPEPLRVHLADSKSRASREAIGMCTGDSGAPVFIEQAGQSAVFGIVSWSSGPDLKDGCGSLAGITPIARYRDWIAEQASSMGSVLGP